VKRRCNHHPEEGKSLARKEQGAFWDQTGASHLGRQDRKEGERHAGVKQRFRMDLVGGAVEKGWGRYPDSGAVKTPLEDGE